MSTRTDLLAAARNLVETVGGVPAAKIVHLGAKGPRPALPYVTIRVTSPGGATGGTERLDGLDDDTPVVTMRERRVASVSVQGYGDGAEEWLDTLQLGIDSPASLSAQEAAGISASVQTPVRDISELLDTAEERRFLLELSLRYQIRSTPASAVELITAEISGDATGGPDALPIDTTYTTATA